MTIASRASFATPNLMPANLHSTRVADPALLAAGPRWFLGVSSKRMEGFGTPFARSGVFFFLSLGAQSNTSKLPNSNEPLF